MSWYLTIRSNAQYSRTASTDALVGYLSADPFLRRNGLVDFRNVEGAPWVCVVFALADGAGNYAISGEPPAFNVVELICGDGDNKWYEALAYRIASHLNWEALETNTERYIRHIE